MELRNIDLEIVKKIWNTVNIKDKEDIENLYPHINAFNIIPTTRGERELNTWWNIATIYKLGVMMGKREERSRKKRINTKYLIDTRENILNEAEQIIHSKK